jgi:hypothetical protein
MEKLCARVQDFTICNSALVQVAIAHPCDALESLWACVFGEGEFFLSVALNYTDSLQRAPNFPVATTIPLRRATV